LRKAGAEHPIEQVGAKLRAMMPWTEEGKGSGSGLRSPDKTPISEPRVRTPEGMTARTLFDKVWDAHVVHQLPEGPALLYVDLHLVHE